MSTYETFGASMDGDSNSLGSMEMETTPKLTTGQSCFLTLFRLLCSRNTFGALALGQGLSILLCGTGIFSGLLQNEDVSTPTAQSFGMYCVLCLVFTTQLAYKQEGRNLTTILLSLDGLKYALIGLIDVEANYLVVKAFQYTTVTSVQILDCFSIATVLVLSRIFLRVHYKATHYIGVLISVLGLGGLIGSDVITGNSESGPGSNLVLGDVLVIVGALLYGVSNVAQEFVVKSYSRSEFLGMLGVFSTVFSGIQVIILEGKDLSRVEFSSYKVVLPWIAYVIFMFILYSCMSYVIQKTSATVTNISILSADFYSLIFGIFIFHYKFHFLYLIAFVVVIFGVAIYSFRPTVPVPEPVQNIEEEPQSS